MFCKVVLISNRKFFREWHGLWIMEFNEIKQSTHRLFSTKHLLTIP